MTKYDITQRIAKGEIYDFTLDQLTNVFGDEVKNSKYYNVFRQSSNEEQGVGFANSIKECVQDAKVFKDYETNEWYEFDKDKCRKKEMLDKIFTLYSSDVMQIFELVKNDPDILFSIKKDTCGNLYISLEDVTINDSECLETNGETGFCYADHYKSLIRKFKKKNRA